ncbi:glycosyltransferase 87 family protein [Janibacter melonis]|uniref:glycosyltransferase 87 family protein n=1 Tax=Janibacter melonis TaxID=262209 RepID=UPI001F2BCCA9|nr:glycosyltransferase 87 family protein [Janibacter melonis]
MTRRTPTTTHWVLAALVFVALAAWPITKFMFLFPQDQWQVDIQVYREAGISVLQGRPIYEQMTDPPQLLPFTYPPVAALLSVPLAFVPFAVAAWSWTILQLAADLAIAWVAWYHLRDRVGAWAPVLVAAVAGAFLWTQPVGDGIRFAQINAFLVLAILLDLKRPRTRLLRAVPPGVLVGLAMAIKLTPGVFVIHYLVCRRWREAATAVVTATLVSVGAWMILPPASFAFWGGALSDPTRLGPNDGSANQAFRALLLRRGLDGSELLLAWAPYLLVIGVVVFWLGRRAYQQGDWLMEAAVIGLAGFLLSPVSWVHHLHWLMVIVPAILGAAAWRDRPRVVAAVIPFAWFVCTMPFWGVLWKREGREPAVVGDVLVEGNVIGSLVILGLLAWAIHRTDAREPRSQSATPGRRGPATTGARGPRAGVGADRAEG